MTAVAQKTVLTGCLAPIDKNGLEQLIANGKANPKVIKTLKCKTVAEGKFRHANYIRNLPPYIVDEPPGLLGDDTAPNPSEASLAALGSCLAVGLHANAVHRGWIVNKLELQLEGDLNITAVWGTGDVSEKPVGFTDVRVKVDMECEGVPQAEIDALVDPRQEVVAGRQHLYPPGQSRGQRVDGDCPPSPNRLSKCPQSGESDEFSGRIASADRSKTPIFDRSSIADAVAAIARKDLAPLAAGDRQRHASIRPNCCGVSAMPAPGAAIGRANGAADLRCAIQSIAALGEVCGATAFMAWCQNTLAWYVDQFRQSGADREVRRRRRGGQDSRRHRAFQSDEELLRNREAEIEGPQGRGRLRRARRAALGLQSRPRSFLRHDFRDRGPARRDRDVPRRLFRSRDHAAAVQAVPRHGRHRHLWRAVPRRLRARRTDPRRAGRAVRQEDPRRLHPAAGRHGARPDQGLHRDHERSRRRRSATSIAICRSSRSTSANCCRTRSGNHGAGARSLQRGRRSTGAASSRFACGPAMPASRPRMRRCFTAARAAI